MSSADDVTDFFGRFFVEYKDDEGNFKYTDRINRMVRDGSQYLQIDYDDMLLYEADDMDISSPLFTNPYFVQDYANMALGEAVRSVSSDFYNDMNRTGEDFMIQWVDLPIEISLRDLRAKHARTMRVVEGIVTRVTDIKGIIREAQFVCKENRDHMVIMTLMDGIYTTPNECSVPTCRSKAFSLESEFSSQIDWQLVTLQEMPEKISAGRTPVSIRCRFTQGMAGMINPGNRVAITGTIRSQSRKTIQKGKIMLLDKWVDVNYVKILGFQQTYAEIDLEEIKEFEKMAKDPKLFEKFVNSFAPTLYGLERVKEALILFLLGGVDKKRADGIKLRGQSNILLVGDPSLGKSALLQYTKSLSDRAIYTSGKGSTAAGLTASMLRDPDTGEWSLEAGAIVLADEGHCLIDEFDKMNENDRSAIHEAMEQNTVSISKAGIVTTLNARTGILAAANPKYGRYESHRTFMENVNLPPTILSRFDLIFPLLDDPTQRDDEARVEYILASHKMEILAKTTETYSTETMQKYIAYAKSVSSPKLSDGAEQAIFEFYINLRKQIGDDKGRIPITDRQLESIIRLAEARAKLNLKKTVSKQDALKAIELVQYCLEQVTTDPTTGKLDIDFMYSGESSTKRTSRSNLDKVMALLSFFQRNYSGPFEEEEFLKEAENEGLSREYVLKTLEQMKRDGSLYTPKPGTLKMAS